MTIRSRQRRPLTTLLSTCYTFRNCFENCVNLSLSFIKWIRTYFSISIVTLEFFFILIRSYYYQWIDTSACGLLVPEGIIHQVVSVSVLTWFIRYIVFSKMYCYQIIQLLLKSPPPPYGYLSRLLLAYSGSLAQPRWKKNHLICLVIHSMTSHQKQQIFLLFFSNY